MQCDYLKRCVWVPSCQLDRFMKWEILREGLWDMAHWVKALDIDSIPRTCLNACKLSSGLHMYGMLGVHACTHTYTK